jgi:hypothetical protein
MAALSLARPEVATPDALSGFKIYLEQSKHNPFVINLENATLVEVVIAGANARSKFHPKYRENIGGLLHNLRTMEEHFNVVLYPIQVTDIFYGYFIQFCRQRGLKDTTIGVMCAQLRSLLSWAAKYKAPVSPSYTEYVIPKSVPHEIALSADDVSRITYFDVDRFYKDRRKDYRETMHRVRDMFVLSCNLYQRHSDMVRIAPSNFDRNKFTISQQKTGVVATVDIDRFSMEPKTTYKILDEYGFTAPYTATIGNYNWHLHDLMRDIGFTETVRVDGFVDGVMTTEEVPKWEMITSHTARRTAITVGVDRGLNIHELRKCSGHTNLNNFDKYIRDE